MTTLLQRPASDGFSKNPNGFTTLDEPLQLWLYPSKISQDSRDSSLQSQREPHARAKPDLCPSDESEALMNFTRKPRRSSGVYVSRDDVSSQRARHLEQNRIAANKCRKKKKKEHQQLLSILHDETAKRETLLAQVKVLKEEVWQLKNRLFEHAGCADQRIDLKLAMMTQNLLRANIEAVHCPSLAFSASTPSDGMTEDGNEDWDNGRIKPGALENIADPMHVPDLQDAVFESFIDLLSMKR